MEVVELSPDTEYLPAVKLLASAFESDPLFKYIYGPKCTDAAKRNERLFRSWFIAASKQPSGCSVAHMSADGSCAAIWSLPGGGHYTLLQLLRNLTEALRVCGIVGGLRMFRLFALEAKHTPAERHAYLEFLGVAEDVRGKGAGSAVLQHMLRNLDTWQLPAYLESSNVLNIPFYERHGFKVIGKVPLSRKGPVFTRMWRDPV